MTDPQDTEPLDHAMQITLSGTMKRRLREAVADINGTGGGLRVSEAALVRDCITGSLTAVIEAHMMLRRAVAQLESERVA